MPAVGVDPETLITIHSTNINSFTLQQKIQTCKKNYAVYMLQHFLNFVFPPICIGCKDLINPGHRTLCPQCFDSLQLLDPSSRCHQCFLPIDEGYHRCLPSPLNGIAACFDDSLSVRALLTTSGSTLSAFMLLQWEALQWPLPDLVIPTPGDWFSHGNDRWNVRKETAKSFAALINRPYIPHLGLNRHLLPTPYLPLEEHPNNALHQSVFVRQKEAIVRTKILLIHDSYSTGNALKASAQALRQCGAQSIWGMSIVNETMLL